MGRVSVTDGELLAALQEVREIVGSPPQAQPSDVTITDYAEAEKISPKTAYSRLMRAVRENKLETELAFLNGRMRRVFRVRRSDEDSLGD